MVKFKIQYKYTTGNSFNSETCTDVLEYEWIDINNAKNALKRIKKHYKWYCTIGSSFDKQPKPVWHKNIENNNIILILDNGNEWQINCPWIGYFETLLEIKVIISGDSELEYTFY